MNAAATAHSSALPSLFHELALIGLTLLMLLALWLMQQRSSAMRSRPNGPGRLAMLIIGWQLLMAALAFAGYFAVFSQPWRALPTVGLSMAVTAYWAARPATLAAWRGVPAWAWVLLQSFRLPLEFLLYSLFLQGVIGRQMSFAGYNFDILVGLSAPVMAWLLHAHGTRSVVQRMSLAWNAAGLLLLTNILIIAVLSVPFPFQVFTEGPANTMVARFPFVWLPTFFIPLALYAHIISMRQAWHDLRSEPHFTTQEASR